MATFATRIEGVLASLKGRRLSPWEIIDAFAASGLIEEVEGEYRVLTPEEFLDAEQKRLRALSKERVHKYRAALKANGEPTSGGTKYRKRVLERDGYRCVYCGAQSDSLIVEHMLSVESGGRSVMENLVAGCRSCNAKKRNMTPDEAGLGFHNPAAEKMWKAIAATLPTSVTNVTESGRLHQLQRPVTLVTASVTPVTGGQLHQLQGGDADTGLPHPNGLNGHQPPQIGENAYIERAHNAHTPPPPLEDEEEVLPLDLASSPSTTGGSGGVAAILWSIPKFRRNTADVAAVERIAAEFPRVDLLKVARDYAGADLKQPPTMGRFRKWVEQKDEKAPARSPTPALVSTKKGLDFS